MASINGWHYSGYSASGALISGIYQWLALHTVAIVLQEPSLVASINGWHYIQWL